MNPAVIEGSWEEEKRKLKARFLSLTNSDLNYELGSSEEMFNKDQIKLSKTRKEILDILAAL